MSYPYTITLTVGDHTWDVTRGDVPAWPATHVLDGLSVGWRAPASPLWPVQPEPTRAAFTLLAPSAADLASIDIGSPVYLAAYLGDEWPAAYPAVVGVPPEVLPPNAGLPRPSVVFAGTVAELQGRPRRVLGGPAWALEVQCVDYLADLADTDVAGVIPYSGMTVRDRVDYLSALADITPPAWGLGDAAGGPIQHTLDGGNVDSEPLLQVLDRLLAAYADAGDITGTPGPAKNHEYYPAEGFRRGIIRSVLDDDTRLPSATLPYRIEWTSRRHLSRSWPAGVSYPARFAPTHDGLWGLELARVPGDLWDQTAILDAAHLDGAATWARTKTTTPRRILVSSDVPPAYAPLWRQVKRVLSSRFTRGNTARVTNCLSIQPWAAEHVAEMYLPDVVEGSRTDYAVESFTYYASADPAWPLHTSWFPDAPGLGPRQPVVVHGIPAEQSPAAESGWYAGTPTGCEFTIARGEFRFELFLRPGAPRPAKDGDEFTGHPALCPDDFARRPLAADLAFVTVDQLDPAHTINDYRLARSLRVDYPEELTP